MACPPSDTPSDTNPEYTRVAGFDVDPTVRVRLVTGPEGIRHAELTIKGKGLLSRDEFNYPIPHEDAVLALPALSIPRMERRVLGSLYGSSRPERDFVTILDLYRRGVLPLDRLISHRLGLDDLDRAFELLRSGEALRVVLDLAPNGAAA